MTFKTLPPRQAIFVAEYLVDLNATQAAIRAGYSAKTAEVQASRLLSNVKVAASIAARRADISKKLEITVERVVLEYAKIGFADFTDYADGQFKLSDKLHALDSVAKHLGMFTERHEVTGKDGAPLLTRIELIAVAPSLKVIDHVPEEGED
jgi:phage terminase small subunit